MTVQTVNQQTNSMMDFKNMSPLKSDYRNTGSKTLFPPKKPDLTGYNADILAKMITTEASGSEDTLYNENEMAAIAHVVLNRVNKGSGFILGEGKTDIEKVIMGKNQFKGVTDLKDRFNNPTKDHPKKYKLALSIANQVLSGKLPDLTGGATYFNQKAVEGLKPIGPVHYFKKFLD
tara:strand:- start:35 stop:562 length:528 start_codon:yes stop_codon:yes gene_type:complete